MLLNFTTRLYLFETIYTNIYYVLLFANRDLARSVVLWGFESSLSRSEERLIDGCTQNAQNSNLSPFTDRYLTRIYRLPMRRGTTGPLGLGAVSSGISYPSQLVYNSVRYPRSDSGQ